MSSPRPPSFNSLIFGGEHDIRAEDVEVAEIEDASKAGTEGGMSNARESMYVELFHEMIVAVVGGEPHLFTSEEFTALERYTFLSYPARYLFIRLCLRKEDKWHRLVSLRYEKEIGPSKNIIKAINELCSDSSNPTDQATSEQKGVKHEEPDCIDLTLDEDEPLLPKAEESALLLKRTKEEARPPAILFAEDESRMSTRELLECLALDELKNLSKQMKLRPSVNRRAMIDLIIRSSEKQGTLDHYRNSSKSQPKKLKQTTLPFAKSQQERLREMVIKSLGKCIRIHKDMFEIVRRINLIYLRSTQYDSTLLTPLILGRAKKRSYAKCNPSRRNDIWPNRDALLEYEQALALEAKIDGILEATGNTRARSVASKTPAPQFKTPGTPNTPASGVRRSTKSKDKENLDDISVIEEDSKPESSRVQDARLVKEIFESIYHRWQSLVVTKGEEEARPAGLERFDCGHVYTRIVCKGANALGTLKEHEYELEVLEALLSQIRWRRGRRGRWYDRRALILMTHYPKHDLDIAERARQGVIDALCDDDTHIVYRPMLARRLTRLEKKLNIPLMDRHTSSARLHKSEETTVEGVRIRDRGSSLRLDNTAKPILDPTTDLQPATEMKWTPQSLKKSSVKLQSGDQQSKEPWKGKSIWRGRDGDEINVETLALQYYEGLGYKGFHCEGRIVCTLFGLLFWDILFADVPGAFETPYQSAPLDIAEDCFYYARKELIEQRLTEIEQGQARKILERVDEEHRSQGTWCVGVRWDLFERQDLLEITDCLGGHSLSTICRLFCEDYSGRGAGVPDLIIWDARVGKCAFVEVKGPGDSLQENQKVWIDVLLRAGVSVELCHVVEQGQAAKKKSIKRVPNSSKRGKAKAQNSVADSESESELAIAESDDDYAFPSDRKRKGGVGMMDDTSDNLPLFIIETRARSASTSRLPTKPIGSDNEEDDIDPSPNKPHSGFEQLPRGTKRKAEHFLTSPTPKILSRSSSSSKMRMEILIPLSPHKRLSTQHS